MIYTSPMGNLQHIPSGNAVNVLCQSQYSQANPKAIAYTDGITGQALSYNQVYLGALKLATYFKSKYGIKSGDVIVLSVYNSIHLPVIHLAALTLGAIISPSNIMYDSTDLAHQFRMVKPKLIIYSEVSAKCIPDALKLCDQTHVTTLNLTEVERTFDELLISDITPTHPIDLDNSQHPAYYCLSSGTSGVPKCVVTTHRNMIAVTLQNAMATVASLTGIKATGAVLPMSHIYGLTSFIWSLPYMAKPIIVYPKFDFEQLLQGIIKYNIQQIMLVPPMVLLFAKSPLVNKYSDVTRIVKLIKSGAAPISRETIELLLSRFPTVEITNGYGMTETSPTSHIKGADPRGVYQLSSVGWVCPSTEMRLVDPDTHEDVLPGQPGEIWVRGPQVMKGYLNNKQATDDMITPDRWLRTGDVGKVDEYEQVYIVDRIKELIKSKGHQVAPAELEGILLQHNDVLDCAVIGIPDENGVTELPRGFVKTNDGASVREILRWFNERVARHKRLWGGIVQLDTIPKNNSGKILRRVLRTRKDDAVVYAQEAKL